MPPFTLTVNKVVTTTEEVEPEVWQLSLERGARTVDYSVIHEPSRIVALFRALNEEGHYRDDVDVIRVDMVDLPDALTTELHNIVTVMQKAIWNAVIPDTPEFEALGVVGMTVENAGAVLIGTYQALMEQEAAAQAALQNPAPTE